MDNLLSGVSVPTAPNAFEERFSVSGEINFRFSPARKETDDLFQLKFFDYIDRFDRLAAGETLSNISPGTTVSVVDLVPELSNEILLDASKPSILVQKQITFFQGGR